MKETKILEKDSFFTNNLFNYANIITETQKKALLIHDSPKHILEFLFLLIGVIFIYYLSLTNQDLKFYFPIIGVYLLASIRLLPSISFIITSLNKVAGLYSSANILYEDFKNFSTEKKYDAKKSNNNLVNINSIRMEDLSFSYKN